jgi:hypothetical protein
MVASKAEVPQVMVRVNDRTVIARGHEQLAPHTTKEFSPRKALSAGISPNMVRTCSRPIRRCRPTRMWDPTGSRGSTGSSLNCAATSRLLQAQADSARSGFAFVEREEKRLSSLCGPHILLPQGGAKMKALRSPRRTGCRAAPARRGVSSMGPTHLLVCESQLLALVYR